jgi:hypothetical protein
MRRLLFFLFSIVVLSIALIGLRNKDAQAQSLKHRTKSVEINFTQYIWELRSSLDNRLICEVIIEHEGQPSLDELMTTCYRSILPIEKTPIPTPTEQPEATLQPTPTPQASPTPFSLTDFYRNVYWKIKNTIRIARTVQVPLPDIVINISAPNIIVKIPYVILSAFEPVWKYQISAIKGKINFKDFFCPGSRCELPISQNSEIEFWALSTSGDESDHIFANVTYSGSKDAYSVTNLSSRPFPIYTDSCSAIWGEAPDPTMAWASFPPTPQQLNTNKTLHYLAGQLMLSGVVNASSCPGDGFLANGAPNACGLDVSRPEIILWQNQFDPVIWTSGRDIGIPPRLIKALIEMESQFWPANARFFLNEFGLGKLTQVGADLALRWDEELFKQVCNGLLYNCNVSYAQLPEWMQATVAGGVLRLVNADCADCPFNINLPNAADSLPVLARTLRANCNQVATIMGRPDPSITSYEDMWKFTLVSYHSGYQCLDDAFQTTKLNKAPLDWENVSTNLKCPASQYYVDEVWSKLDSFDSFALKASSPYEPILIPTFSPTSTPTLKPTPVIARSKLHVIVYMDYNNDQQPQPNEMIDGIEARISFSDSTSLTQIVRQGISTFDLTGQTINSTAEVHLPLVFRSNLLIIPETGELTLEFRLVPPVLPSSLP